ncbi:hypothetical protein BD289DRAFT_450037 [Coniella lustricola]|uniref:Phytanoyl-CoA dioxygenase n=1 Tax=Coniella lustricola TaxID=2025994 RepID=A0A2T3AK97_9PEZI|nr:hypothetical protein BD289DRAFT_450037 [Coniella lustricola]
MTPDSVLSPEQKDHFLNHGWIKIPKAFTEEQAAEMIQNVWTRLGMDPNDKSTWHTARTHMPSHRTFDAAQFAPRAWAAICELCGGENRINPSSRQWRDSLIVSLGSGAPISKHNHNQPNRPPTPPQTLQGWHVDGDFFIHYLDSPEQALLVIPLFTPIPRQGGGGGTALYPAGMRAVAAHLYAHPEGVSPRMVPRGEPGFLPAPAGTAEQDQGKLNWFNTVASRGGADGHGGDDFVEVTGDTGDVYLLHPLMLHSSTNNPLRNVRIITNPPVSLKKPFCFNRDSEKKQKEEDEQDEDSGVYSLVERATLRMIGRERDGLQGWKITHEREKVVPERVRIQERMKQEELKRLALEKNTEGKKSVTMVRS